MKRYIILPLAFLVLAGCKKNTEGNKNVISGEPKIEEKEESAIYKGLQNSVAKVTFTESEKGNTATIQANGKKFILDKKSDILYERNGIRAELKGDSLYIIQDDNIIPLKKAF